MRVPAAFLLVSTALCAQSPTKDEALRAMRKAAEFYRHKVSTEGGYHYHYTADLS